MATVFKKRAGIHSVLKIFNGIKVLKSKKRVELLIFKRIMTYSIFNKEGI